MGGFKKMHIENSLIEVIINRAVAVNSMYKALNQLREENVLDVNISNSTYKRNAVKTDVYKLWIKSIGNKRLELKNKVQGFASTGTSCAKIGRTLGLSTSKVWDILHKTNKNQKSAKKINAQELIDYWNKYSTENSVMSNETIKAFEL